MSQKKSLLSGIVAMKCPNCRKGNMFCNKSIFPLKEMFKMPEKCSECGQKMELEIGFYYGTGYVSYGISIALSVFNLVWFALFVGLSWKNNSFFWYLGINIVIIALLQPWIIRYSRVLYLNMFVKYGKGSNIDKPHHGQIIEKEQPTQNNTQN